VPVFDLPAISSDARPDFVSAADCAAWLEALPLINVGPSHGRLLGQLEELNCVELLPQERIRILELLREPVTFVQGEHGKKFSARAVPLAKGEREIFHNVLALWDGLAHGWQRCLQEMIDGAPDMGAYESLVCQRALWCTGQKMAEHYRAYQEVGVDDWRRLNSIYAVAESRAAVRRKVPHPGYKAETQTNCAETYAGAMLLALANPNEHTPRQQMLVARWIDSWARNVELSAQPPADEGIPPLCVDLHGAAGVSRQPRQGEHVRFLDVQELGKSLKKRLASLKKGDTPESLGLGTDVPAVLAAQMLSVLYHQWCDDKTARQQPRTGAARQADVCSGIAAMHFYISGQPFKQPASMTTELTQAQREQIAIFGRTSGVADEKYAATHVAALERWTIADESLTGFRLERPEGAGQSRFLHHQLVAVKPSDARAYILSVVRWLALSENYELRMGTKLLPGAPAAIAVRPTGLNAMNEKFVPALSLPAVTALQSPPTLVLPLGWFRPKRVVEIYTDKAQHMLLTGVVDRGDDYERCTYAPI
jgi:hypothetical protein